MKLSGVGSQDGIRTPGRLIPTFKDGAWRHSPLEIYHPGCRCARRVYIKLLGFSGVHHPPILSCRSQVPGWKSSINGHQHETHPPTLRLPRPRGRTGRCRWRLVGQLLTRRKTSHNSLPHFCLSPTTPPLPPPLSFSAFFCTRLNGGALSSVFPRIKC